MFHKSVVKTLDTNSPKTFTASPAHMKVSTVFHDSYFLEGVYLTGGTPFVEWVEHLGVAGVETLGVAPHMVGWSASVEMIGLVDFPTLLPYQLLLEVSHSPLV